MDERDNQWIMLVTYARAAGATSCDEATFWAREAAATLGMNIPPEVYLRRIDEIAARAVPEDGESR